MGTYWASSVVLWAVTVICGPEVRLSVTRSDGVDQVMVLSAASTGKTVAAMSIPAPPVRMEGGAAAGPTPKPRRAPGAGEPIVSAMRKTGFPGAADWYFSLAAAGSQSSGLAPGAARRRFH